MPALPRVTIITPSFNQAAYLEATLTSVLDQDYPDLEYFVFDGGSSDGSPEIIRKYASRLAGWVSEPDRGQADAINKGLARASGEVVAWLNSDDIYTPNAVRSAVQALQAHPQAGLVYGNTLSIDAAGKVFHRVSYGDWGLPDLMSFKIIGQPAVFMRRDVLRKTGGLNLSLHCLLDHELWLRLACCAPVQHIPQTWAAARFHPLAKNLARVEEFGREALQLAAWMQASPDFGEYYPKISRQVWAGAHRLNAWYLAEGDHGWPALRAYLRSASFDPAPALKDWKRVIYSAGLLFGARWLRSFYNARRAGKAEHVSAGNLSKKV